MRPVRWLFAVVVVCLYASSGFPATASAGERAETPSIEIMESVRFHPRSARLNELCRVDRDVHACTDFVREQFDCECVEGSDGWRITVAAKLEAVIHVTAHRYLTHERLHVGDIEAELPAALAPFLDRRFTSRSACETLAGVMSLPSFAVQLMNKVRIGSNERLGCTKLGSAATVAARRRAE